MILAALALAQAAPAAAAHPAPVARAAGDPWERFNRSMFRRFQSSDRRFVRPAATAYRRAVPGFVRGGLRHFFSNLGEPVVFLNYLLQLKPGKAAETATRFLLNSTLGLAGTVDVAASRGVRLPHRPNGLGDTLGYYGVGPGPYLFLPFLGPTTLRDLLGGQADGLVLPLAVGKPFDKLYYQAPRAVLTGLDQRAENDADLRALLGDAVDPYATLRSTYLQDRAGEIAHLHGRAANAGGAPELGEPLADPGAASAPPELGDPLADPAVPAPAKPAPSAAPELSDPLADPAAPKP